MARAAEELQDLANSTSDLLSLHRLDGTVSWANPAAARMVGLPPGSTPGLRTQDLLSPEDRSGDDRFVEGLLERGEVSGVIRGVTAIGEVRVLRYRSTLGRREGEEPLLPGLAIDMTDARGARRELGRTIARSERLLDAIGGVVWETAPDGSRMRSIPPAVERPYGRPASAFLEGPSLWRRVILPSARCSPVPGQVARPAAPPPGGQAVLLVGDEDGVREPLARLLTVLGCRVTAVGGVAEALAAAGDGAFELLPVVRFVPGRMIAGNTAP